MNSTEQLVFLSQCITSQYFMYNNTSMKIKLYYFCFFGQHFAWLRAASDNVFSSN